jgi:probable HAF family extracellular repeat protein
MSLRRAVSAVAVLAVIAAYSDGRLNSQSSPTYTVVDLSAALPTSGIPASVVDINSFGTIAGMGQFSQCCPTSTYFVPFIFKDGSVQQLPIRGRVGALNDKDEIAGSNSATFTAFLYRNGTTTDIGTTLNRYGGGINASGDVAGYGFTSDGRIQTFIYSGGAMTQLEPGPVARDTGGVSPKINASGILAGTSLYSGGVLIPFPDGVSAIAGGINDAGQVVGVTSSPRHAFLFSQGVFARLGTLAGTANSSGAADINNAGVIVGASDVASLAEGTHGFIYRNGTMTDLNTIASVPAGFTINSANSINDSGYIVGSMQRGGTEFRPILLVPTASATPTMARSPEDISIVQGSDATFFAVANGVPLPTYRWQMTSNGVAWFDLSDAGPFSGTSTPQLKVTGATTALNGWPFRVVATNAAGSATSAEARLTVTSSTVAPAITVQPVNANTGLHQNATFSVTATGTAPLMYQWRHDGVAIPGAVHPTLLITDVQSAHAGNYSVVVTNAAGSVTSAGAGLLLSVATAILTPDALYFAAERNASSGIATVSAPQDVAVRFSTGAPAWSVSADQSWVTLSNASGTGAGRFTVAINPNAVPAGTTATATVTLTMPAGGSTTTLLVRLTIQPAVSTAGPFGAFDTPTGSATVAGSVAVTGWALDDVGVERVELWRDLAPGETTPPFASTPTDPRNGKVFIATATFVSGSRPDVESAYPTMPASSRAGWGYLMLTYGLWNRGNGTYTLYAFGVDQDAHVTQLGTKTITSNNATATKPFGAIDTPEQGATVSGTVTNFGWALTPGTTCTVAGGSVQVSIDSGPLQPVIYGGARADVAAAFPGYTDANAAGGSYTLNTTTLSNGLHTIGWYVTDSCGRADGVGSRFFSVANGSLTAAARASAPAPPAARAIAWSPIAARLDDGGWTSIAATTTGDRLVAVAQDERLELQVPAHGPLTGRLIVNGTERPLPIGSSLDAAAGVFRWQPAPGFLGRFDLVFVDTAGTATRVRVLVRPARSPRN